MPKKPCYWTRQLELKLVEFIKHREYIWKPNGNTNHQIQRKYKAYAEFAAQLGRGFTARSVRDRWVNIRSTFHHNLRRIEKSKEKSSSAELYVPCWPLWKPLQFLLDTAKTENPSNDYDPYSSITQEDFEPSTTVKEELQSETETIELRQRRTHSPRKKNSSRNIRKNQKCKKILNDLVTSMMPLTNQNPHEEQPYWFFGKHVTARLNQMNNQNAECARNDITKILAHFPSNKAMDFT